MIRAPFRAPSAQDFPRLGWARLLVLALCCGFGIAVVIANARSWQLEDAEAYWKAALRLREGGPLYIPVIADADETNAYRYAPWLAWAWTPLTLLPKQLVQVGWSAILLGSIAISLAPLVRVRSVAAVSLASLMGGLLVRTASTGNVHALLIALLVYGVTRRSGPLFIGIAASVKLVPIMYAVTYVRRGQWGKATIAIGVMAVLVAPILLYDLSGYPTDPGESFSVWSLFGIVPYLVGALAAAALAIRFAAGRYRWVAASVAILAALPRLDLYDLTYLLVAVDERGERAESGR